MLKRVMVLIMTNDQKFCLRVTFENLSLPRSYTWRRAYQVSIDMNLSAYFPVKLFRAHESPNNRSVQTVSVNRCQIRPYLAEVVGH